MRYHIPVRMATIKKTKITNIGDDMEERIFSYSIGGDVN
jgi:hypothetical protein